MSNRRARARAKANAAATPAADKAPPITDEASPPQRTSSDGHRAAAYREYRLALWCALDFGRNMWLRARATFVFH